MKSKIKLLLINFLLLSCFSFAQTYHSKARIYVNSIKDLEYLSKKGVTIDHGLKKSKKYIESVFSTKEIEIIKKSGFRVDILIKNMEKHILKRNKNLSNKNTKNSSCATNTINYTTPNNFNLGSVAGFLTYEEIIQELDDMRTTFPNLISAKSSIHTFTTEDGNTIQWVKISDNPDIDEDESEVLYTALHHAREPASMQQLIFYMWYLLENYATNNEVKAIVDNTELYFIPVVNPDGYIYNVTTSPNGNGFWRKNRKNNGNGTFGVDNNRNYDYIDTNGNSVWNTTGTSNNPNADNYAGTAPFSEVENQAVKWFVEQHDFKIALNNHTYGNTLLYPFGYQNLLTTDNNTFVNITNEMVSQNDYSNYLSANLYPAAGDSDDFMYGETSTHNKIYAMTPEIGDSFWPAQNTIIGICKSMVYFNISAAHSANNYAIISDRENNYITSTTGNIGYSIQRLGITGTGSFSLSIEPISSNIVSVGGINNHNSLNLLETREGTINYELSSSITIGETIEYKIIIDNGLYKTEKIISKVFGNPQLPVDEDGNNIANWQTTNNWGITNTGVNTSPTSITDSPTSNYQNNENSSIEINDEIDLTNAGLASVSFYAKWNIETSYDYVQFEISTDNGNSWIPQCGNFTRKGTNEQGVAGQPIYDGVQDTWVLENIDLSDYLGNNIKVRFQLVSDDSNTKDGFYFDDFKVSVINNSVLGKEPVQTTDVKIFPNPAKDELNIALPFSKPTVISIYDLNGRLIKNKALKNSNIKFSLKNISTGIYILQLQTETSNNVYKIIKQ